MTETTEKSWTANQLRFMAWLALPGEQRKPRYQRGFAVEIQVAEPTLSEWKKLPGFMDEVNRMARELVKHDIADVLGVIRTRAKQGDLAYVNMVLAMAGMAADVQAAQPQTIVKVYAGFDPTDV